MERRKIGRIAHSCTEQSRAVNFFAFFECNQFLLFFLIVMYPQVLPMPLKLLNC